MRPRRTAIAVRGIPATRITASCSGTAERVSVAHVRELLSPPVARLRSLDFKGGIALIESAYRYAADALAKSGLAKRIVT